MIKHLFIALAVVVMTAGLAMAEEREMRKVEAKIISTGFCSPERESACVKTSKGDFALMSPYSGVLDHNSFNELFYLLHLVEDSTVTLIIEGEADIVGLKAPGFGFIAPWVDMANKKLVPRKMP